MNDKPKDKKIKSESKTKDSTVKSDSIQKEEKKYCREEIGCTCPECLGYRPCMG